MSKKVKRILKSLLAASLLITGFIMNPLNTKANDEMVQPASPVTVTTQTKSYVLVGTNVPSLQVTLSYYLNNDGTTTRMSYKSNSATCELVESGTCSIENVTTAGESYTGSNSVYYITLKIKAVKNGVTYKMKHQLQFRQNNLIARNYLGTY